MISGMRKLRAKEINDLSQAQDWLEVETRREGFSSRRLGGLLLCRQQGLSCGNIPSSFKYLKGKRGLENLLS